MYTCIVLLAFILLLLRFGMAGLKRDFTSFAYYTLTLLLLSIASSSTAFNTAAGQHNYPLAISVMLFVFSFQLVSLFVLSKLLNCYTCTIYTWCLRRLFLRCRMVMVKCWRSAYVIILQFGIFTCNSQVQDKSSP